MRKVPLPIKKLGREYFKTVTTMLASAFGLVAALAWNDLVKRAIDLYVAPGSDVLSQLIYAVIVTTMVVIFTIWAGKVASAFAKEEESASSGKEE